MSSSLPHMPFLRRALRQHTASQIRLCLHCDPTRPRGLSQYSFCLIHCNCYLCIWPTNPWPKKKGGCHYSFCLSRTISHSRWNDHTIYHQTQRPACICDLIKYCRTPHAPVILAFCFIPQTLQPHSNLSGFTLPVPSSWNALPQNCTTGLNSLSLISAITFPDLPWVVPSALSLSYFLYYLHSVSCCLKWPLYHRYVPLSV